MTVRCRFAPNPSGDLHVGSVHTALFSWLYARHHGGAFVLRIEDTDAERARQEFIDPICVALEWLGLDWDEGPGVGGPHEPYRDSERLELHRDAAAKLEASGHLYRCWCTRDEITARGRPSGYDRHCRTLTDSARAAFEGEGRPYVLRLAVPEGEAVVFEDVILGELRKEYEELMDPVVERANRTPLYALAVTCDDLDMGMTHVIRGTDLLDSTFTQMILYRAMGASPPVWAHVPIVLGPDRDKLGKRHGSVGALAFRDAGFLPEALVNYLALLGWSSPSLDEFLTLDRIVAEFGLERVNPAPSVFDHKKLEWMNQEYIKKLAPPELERRIVELRPDVPRDVLHKTIELDLIQMRTVTLGDVPGAIRYLHERPSIDPAAREKVLTLQGAPETLRVVADRLASLEPWTIAGIQEMIQGVVEELGLHRRKGPQAVFVAVSGKAAALPLFESIWIIGREEAVARLRLALE